MKDVVIVSACRTAIGAFGGTLKEMNAALDYRVALVKLEHATGRDVPRSG